MIEGTKIALCGSAPASVRSAPYGDPSWKIFGCSPGLYGIATRVDMWFETHLWEPGQQWFSPEYVQWLQGLPKRGVILFTGAEDPDAPTYGNSPVDGAVVLPHKEILAEFDPNRWFCTSSLFWMFAIAIKVICDNAAAQGRKPTPELDKIGLWGIDMAANEEYEAQRAGCHYMALEARKRGIEVGVPHESDLFTPRFRYGIDEWTHGFRKTRARLQELERRAAETKAREDQAHQEHWFLLGAIDDQRYMQNTWMTKATYTAPAADVLGLDAVAVAPIVAPIETPKRKRGRPRKVESIEVVKRPRGRPRKLNLNILEPTQHTGMNGAE